MPITPTCRVGSLQNTRKVGEKEGDKDKEKEKEKEKLVAKPTSSIQVINLDGDTNPMDEQDTSQQGDTLAHLMTKFSFFLATSQRKKTPLVLR